MQDRLAGIEILLPHALCPVLAGNRMKISGSAYLEPSDISRVSVKQVLALALRTGLF
jgi:hypothetical protein